MSRTPSSKKVQKLPDLIDWLRKLSKRLPEDTDTDVVNLRVEPGDVPKVRFLKR